MSILTSIWHIVSPADVLDSSNGSAVLRVARELQHEAWNLGNECKIVGSLDKVGDLDGVVGLLSPAPQGLRTLAVKARRIGFGPPARGSLSEAAMKELRDSQQPDIVVLHNLPWLAREVRLAFPGSVVVLYVHNTILNRVPRPRIADCFEPIDSVVCVSGFIADYVRHIGVAPSKVHTVLNGVRASKQCGAAGRDFDIGFVGRLIPQKGVDLLLESADLAGRDLGRRLRIGIVGRSWFFGNGSRTRYEAQLQEISDSENLNVEFVGLLAPADVQSFMDRCGVVCIPSVWAEPCSLVLLEAMSSSAAVVATRTGGSPEVVGESLNLVDPRPRDVSSELVRILGSAHACNENAELTKRRAESLTWRRSMLGLLSAAGVMNES